MEQSDYYKKKRRYLRFHPDLDGLDSVKLYFRNHAISLLHIDGLRWSGIVDPVGDWGAVTRWRVQNESVDRVGYSVYVFASHRGKGHMSRWLKENAEKTIFTNTSCELESYLKKRGADFCFFDGTQTPPDRHPFDPEYSLVASFYGDRVTDRTGCHMMNHIDEGIYILQKIGASDLVIRAYIIHPLVQGDTELQQFWNRGLDRMDGMDGMDGDTMNDGDDGYKKLSDSRVFSLALEYRNIANAHLSWHPPAEETPFHASPLKEVNDMLIADKIQNRKDFELYHQGSHPRAERLRGYFAEWLEKLEVSEMRYRELCADILDRTGGRELALLQKRIVGISSEKESMEKQLGYVQVFGNSKRDGGSREFGEVSSREGLGKIILFGGGVCVGMLVSSVLLRGK